MKKLLEDQAKSIARDRAGNFAATVTAVILTAGLVSQFPLVLYGLGRFFQGASEYDLGRSIAAACSSTAGLAFLLFVISQAFRPNGLAPAHFGWDSKATGVVRRHLRWLTVVLLPLWFVAAALGEDGLRFHSQPDLRAYSNGLERLCFMLLAAALTVAVHRIFHPAGIVNRALFRHARDSWASHLRHVWFALLLGLSLLPGILASQGYYITGSLLLVYILRTVLLIVILVLIGEMLVRWRISKQRHLARDRKKIAVGHEDEVEEELRSAEGSGSATHAFLARNHRSHRVCDDLV